MYIRVFDNFIQFLQSNISYAFPVMLLLELFFVTVLLILDKRSTCPS